MPSGRRTVSSAKGSALPLPSYTTQINPWQPETENVHTALGSCDVLASPDELLPWPILQGGYGVNFRHNCNDDLAVPLSLYDQGR